MITSQRTFGIELEMGAKEYGAIQKLRNKIGRGWRFDDDGSIRDVVSNPIEVVSPILRGSEGEKAVRDTCKLLKELEFDANHLACGNHVHLGAEEFKAKDGYIVLTEEQLELFLKSEKNKKDILDVAFLNTDAVKKFYKLRSDRPLRKRYLELSKQVFNSGFGTTITNYRSNDTIFMVDKLKDAMPSKKSKSRLLYIMDSAKYKELRNKAKMDSSELEKQIVTLHRGSDDHEKEVKLNQALDKVHGDFKEAVGKYYKKKEGKYVIRVRETGNTQNLINLFLFYLIFDDVFMGMLPLSRREHNSYCMPLSTTFTVQEVLACRTQKEFELLWYKEREERNIDRHKNEHYDNSRYHNVNFHSLFNRHGTIEIRSHGATINPNKILLWVALHQHVVDAIASGAISREMLSAIDSEKMKLEELALKMMDLLSLPIRLEKYVRRLLSYYSGAGL